MATRPKVSICLRDNERVRSLVRAVRREHFGECRRNGPQGMCPGWVDVYTADLDVQTLLLPPGTDDRLLCLDLSADPRDQLIESNESVNASSN